MTAARKVFRGGRIFDGAVLHEGCALVLSGSCVDAILPETEAPRSSDVVDLGGDILSPGFVDLQVNGGGGVMFNDDPTLETLSRIAEAHRNLGCAAILPTLITDTPDVLGAALEAARAAIDAKVPGIAGLHLEGPHLAPARRGAHAGDLIRPMSSANLTTLLEAATRLPVLMVTLAPESVREEQVLMLTEGGVVVSLGHTDADYETCRRYAAAGATSATHLFNAMGGLSARAPGLVGAVLADGSLSAGLIADGVHVDPAVIGAAIRAKSGPGAIYLVSDAMAAAGSDLTRFTLNGRPVKRHDGRLTLGDGTLAGADLDLVRAIRVLVTEVGTDLARALAMATSIPAGVAGISGAGRLRPKSDAVLVRISHDLSACTPVAGG